MRASHLGELVAIDATPLDVFAMDAVTGKWCPVHLLVAIDLCTRSLVGWRFTGFEPNAFDATMLLRDIISVKSVADSWPVEGQWRYTGVPKALVVGLSESQPLMAKGEGDDPAEFDDDGNSWLGVPAVVPDTIVLDHGKIFVSNAFVQACATLGVTMFLARPYTPTDKSHVERVFKTIRESFVERLPGYKGPDVFSRGATREVEDAAFLFIEEIADRFAAWVSVEYQNAPHDGLRWHAAPEWALTPNQAVDMSIAAMGYVPVPVSQDLLIELLPTKWLSVRGSGLEFLNLVYDEENNSVLDEYRNRASPHTAEGGKWRVKYDPRDVSKVWFFAFTDPNDPVVGDGSWVPIPAKGIPAGAVFSERTLAFVKRQIATSGQVPNRENVVAALRGLLKGMPWVGDDLSREAKLAARAEAAAIREAERAAAPVGQETLTPKVGTGPDDLAVPRPGMDDGVVVPITRATTAPASGRRTTGRLPRETPVLSAEPADGPLAMDEISDYDPFGDLPEPDMD